MIVEVSVDPRVQIRADLRQLDVPIVQAAVPHAMEDAHRVTIYARVRVQVVALQDAEQVAQLLVNQMQPVVVL